MKFVNAFPDLNDVAPDGSLSQFPSRAKYSFPLHFVLNPFAVRKEYWEAASEDVTTDFLLSGNFERAHMCIGGTEHRFAFRKHLLGPFYTTLVHALLGPETVGVPLVPDPDGTGIQREWAAVDEWFRSTGAFDEAFSLLIGVISINDKSYAANVESRWFDQEARENPRFAAGYREFRRMFNPDDCTSAEDRVALAERALAFAKVTLSLYGHVLKHGGRAAQSVSVSEVYGDSALDPMIPPPTATIDAFQRIIGYDALLKSYREGLNVEYSYLFSPEIVNEPGGKRRIEVRPTVGAVDLVPQRLTSEGGGPMRRAEAHEIVAGSFFFESMRQQVCRGVGLMCPWWEGNACCAIGDFPDLLQHIWQTTKPWHPTWRVHWRPPPCLP